MDKASDRETHWLPTMISSKRECDFAKKLAGDMVWYVVSYL